MIKGLGRQDDWIFHFCSVFTNTVAVRTDCAARLSHFRIRKALFGAMTGAKRGAPTGRKRLQNETRVSLSAVQKSQAAAKDMQTFVFDKSTSLATLQTRTRCRQLWTCSPIPWTSCSSVALFSRLASCSFFVCCQGASSAGRRFRRSSMLQSEVQSCVFRTS